MIPPRRCPNNFRVGSCLARDYGVYKNLTNHRCHIVSLGQSLSTRAVLDGDATQTVLMQVNERWPMDFVYDQLTNGRRFRVLNVINDYSREMIAQLAMFSFSAGGKVSKSID